jgi:hypothetical protein
MTYGGSEVKFVSLRVTGLTEKMLVEALGRRALAGMPVRVDELIQGWAAREATTDLTDDARLAEQVARAIPTELDEALKSAEAEFTEPPAYGLGGVLPVGVSVRGESYVHKGDETANVTDRDKAYRLESDTTTHEALDVGGQPVVLHREPEDSVLVAAEVMALESHIEAEEADQERNPQPRKPRRTKNEMALARNAVTNAYRTAVDNSPWSEGWEKAHVAGLVAADAAGANAGLTPYQTRQAVSPLVAYVREQFDEPRTNAPDTADHGPDDAAVQRVENIVINEQPPKHAEPEDDHAPPAEVAAIHGLPSTAPGVGWQPAVEEMDKTEGDPYPTLAEVANPADYGLAPAPATPTDDDVFAQFLKG